MNWLFNTLKSFFGSHKPAITAIMVSAAMAGFQSAQSGKVNWVAVGAAAVTTIGALAKSPLTPKEDPPAGDASPN